jgi:hypothetical protein
MVTNPANRKRRGTATKSRKTANTKTSWRQSGSRQTTSWKQWWKGINLGISSQKK